MYATRFVEGLLGSQTASEKSSSNAMSACASLLLYLNKAKDASTELKMVKELCDLSNQYPYLPLGKAATNKIMKLVKASMRTDEKTENGSSSSGSSSSLHALRPCVELLKNTTKPAPPSSERERAIVNENLAALVADNDHVLTIMELVGERDPYIQLGTVMLLTNILQGKKDRAQQIILSKPTAVNKLVTLLDNTGDMVRNEALLLIRRLIEGHPTIQKIVAFDGVFDRVLSIAEQEGYVMGGAVLVDILDLLRMLVERNTSNQTLFVETGCVARLVPLLRSASGKINDNAGSAHVERQARILDATLKVLDCLLSPNHRVSAQKDLCPALLGVVSARAGLTPQVRVFALELLAKIIDSRPRNQACLVSTSVTVVPVITDFESHLRSGGGVEGRAERRSALVYILRLAMGKDPQSLDPVPADLMATALYTLRCLLRKNFGGQTAVGQAMHQVALAQARQRPPSAPGSPSRSSYSPNNPNNPNAHNPLRLFAQIALEGLALTDEVRARAHACLLAAAAGPRQAQRDGKGELGPPYPANAALWASQTVLLHVLRGNPMAKKALAAPVPLPDYGEGDGAEAAGPSMSLFQMLLADVLDWERHPAPHTNLLPDLFSAPLDADDSAGDQSSWAFVPWPALVGRLLLCIEGISKSPTVVRQLVELDSSPEVVLPPPFLDLLIRLAGGAAASKTRPGWEVVAMIRGLASVALVVCLKHAMDAKTQKKQPPAHDQQQKSRVDLEAVDLDALDKLHSILVSAMTSSSRLSIQVLKANLVNLSHTAEFKAAKQRLTMPGARPDRCPKVGEIMTKRAGSTQDRKQQRQQHELPFDLLDGEFVSRFEKLLGGLDSMLLELLTSVWEDKNGTATPQTPMTPALNSASPSAAEVHRLKRALAAATKDTKEAKKKSSTLAVQLKRALEAIKRLEATAKTGKAEVTNDGTRDSQAQAMLDESKEYIRRLEGQLEEERGRRKQLEEKIGAAANAEQRIAALRREMGQLQEENQDLLVLLASEDVDKSYMLEALEKLRAEVSYLRGNHLPDRESISVAKKNDGGNGNAVPTPTDANRGGTSRTERYSESLRSTSSSSPARVLGTLDNSGDQLP
mmetsp:Transcript_31767/g.77414  ORF Transcript_31767/g.77414 Transcript_31767/m.77414 type:complete len:1094 (+) Transcript_31767:142-3423(+)